MHLTTTIVLLATTIATSSAQSSPFSAAPAATAVSAGNDQDHWCGRWAGVPNEADVPKGQQLPTSDYTKRLFVEPQLQRVPFSPVSATEPKVQVPKIWGNDWHCSATPPPNRAPRVYSSSKSRWADFHVALELLMTNCVHKGSGGAYLVPPSPGLTQSTLAIYAYEVGSQFDFQMNYYMSTPQGINPARLGLGTGTNLAVISLNETDIDFE
ncbi:hypothetical protein ACLMJK_003893 [Lecanora helva]